ncbi:MAG: prepilin-type N-terminal cleavage/methylation domain-containing protein [Candidatus Omnitrophica bacterium]|nr:prepilin-type N-terminal cleavage/methylation domain-containing protein [Candidatus Omnitrophota bacterium]
MIKFRNKSGIGLIELMVVLVLGSLGIFAVSQIVVESYKGWKRSNEIAALQSDFDIASLMIKGIIEEASSVEIPVSNHIIVRNVSSGWIQEFYQDSTRLVWKNSRTGLTQNVITSLKNISFEVDESDDSLINVSLEVQKGQRIISGTFSVFMRNSL